MWKLGVATAVAAAMLALPAAALGAGQQISVNGTGGATVPAGATNAQQQAAYDQALSAAIGDAQAKAAMVAQQFSLTLGAVQTVTEESDDYLGYCGVGFIPGVAAAGVSGSANAPTAATGASSGKLTPIPTRPKRHKHKKKAHKAASESESSCQVQADVTVLYAAS